MSANIRGRLILDLAAYLVSLGHDPDRVFATVGVPLTLDQETRVPVEAPMELIEEAAKQVEQADFGLRLARFRGMPDLGPLALLLRDQKDLSGALQSIAQAFYLHSNALYLSILDVDATVILAADLVTSGTGLSRQSAEMIVGAITEMLRAMLGPTWRPAGISFRHAQALPASVYRKHFGLNPEFEQEHNAVVLARADLSRPLVNRDVEADRTARAIADMPRTDASTFVYRVQQLIVLTLPQGEARAGRVADLLQMDRRTLHRRLQAGGATFSRLLHDVRLEFALQYVRGSERSQSEIALLVGFDGLSVFSRWFRHATGSTPTELRRQSRGAAG